MAAILLTSDNIQFVKADLRRIFPTLKSSHLSEALAYAAGFRTHAALIAAMKGGTLGRPILAGIDPDRISQRMAAFGYANLESVPVDKVVRSDSLPDRIWSEFRNGDRYANDRWFYECRRRDIPNLYLERRRKYVKLNWDCISIDPSGEEHVQGARGTALVQIMFETYQSIARRMPGKSMFFGTSFAGSVDNLIPELAHEIADEFFALLYEPMRAQSLVA